MKKSFSISIIGAGNVSTHLAKALHRSKYKIDYILSRTKSSASKLARLVKAKSTVSYKKLLQSDLIIIAVSDNAISYIASNINSAGKYNGILAHTSGSVTTSLLKKGSSQYGSFYPLQSFNKDESINMRNVPFCISGSDPQIENLLFKISSKLSNKIYRINDKQRLQLHLAAVFANNFGNHMLTIAQQLCEQNQVSFDILKPLIIETFSRIESNNPIELQTGPAKRKDTKVIQKHKRMLNDDKSLKELYNLISKHIHTTYA